MDFIFISEFFLLVFFGIVLGYFYGFSFIKEKKKIFLSEGSKLAAFSLSISTLLKYLSLAAIMWFLSRYRSWFPLTGAIAFLSGFWWRILRGS